MKPSRPLVSVDCDTLIFKCASAVEDRSINVLHKPTGKEKIFKNRTEFKESMKNREKVITEDYLISDVQKSGDVSHALKLVKSKIEQIRDNFSDCEVVFGATHTNNFRDSLEYPVAYKGNRVNAIRPIHLKETQQYVIGVHKAVVAVGCEQDDYSAIVAYDAVRRGRKAYLLTPDGDARQFDGLSLGDYDDTPNSCIDINFMHKIEYNEKGFQSYGFPWLIMQACVGDITDGLNPCYLNKKRYGEKGHYNATKNFKTPEQHANYMISLYKEWYPNRFKYTSHDGRQIMSDWKHMLELYWKGTTMKRSLDDELIVWEFLKDRGIDYDSDW